MFVSSPRPQDSRVRGMDSTTDVKHPHVVQLSAWSNGRRRHYQLASQHVDELDKWVQALEHHIMDIGMSGYGSIFVSHFLIPSGLSLSLRVFLSYFVSRSLSVFLSSFVYLSPSPLSFCLSLFVSVSLLSLCLSLAFPLCLSVFLYFYCLRRY